MARGTLPERTFERADPASLPTPALSLGIAGPPGGGKTKSALRIADGIARVRGGRPALIETEPGRAAKYLKSARNPDGHEFDLIPFAPPFAPEYFAQAIAAAERLNPAAIIIDSASDEHEGDGGVLDWHDKCVEDFGGNEFAAWGPPKKSRRKFIQKIEHTRTPLILTFRAREKTTTREVQKRGRTVNEPVNIGFMPVGSSEVFHALDLVCVLPPKANGVAVWDSVKAGEDFTIKIPEFLVGMIRRGETFDEAFGEALARWQKGDVDASGRPNEPTGERRRRTPPEMTDAYIARINAIEDLDVLRSFQTEDATRRFLDDLKAKHPALWDRAVEANSKAAARLAAADEPAGDEDDVDFPADPALAEPGGA